MDGLRRTLIEINDILVRSNREQSLASRQYQYVSFNSDGNDTTIINETFGGNCNECDPGPPGPIGFTGSQGYTGSSGSGSGYTGSQGFTGSAGSGPIGYTGSQGADGSIGFAGSQGQFGPSGYTGSAGADAQQCTTILVSQDYTANVGDYYIGVTSTGPVTITLPANPPDCIELVIKAQMGPPIGNRKVTITTSDGSTIDGGSDYVLVVPYQSVNVMSQGSNWWII